MERITPRMVCVSAFVVCARNNLVETFCKPTIVQNILQFEPYKDIQIHSDSYVYRL